MIQIFSMIFLSLSRDLYQVYDMLNLDFLNSFPNKSCISFSSIGLGRICKENPSVIFIEQFSVHSVPECQNDLAHYQSIQDAVLQFEYYSPKPSSQITMQIQFNYLRGNKFYDPPTVESIVKNLNATLKLVCGELNSV